MVFEEKTFNTEVANNHTSRLVIIFFKRHVPECSAAHLAIISLQDLKRKRMEFSMPWFLRREIDAVQTPKNISLSRGDVSRYYHAWGVMIVTQWLHCNVNECSLEFFSHLAMRNANCLVCNCWGFCLSVSGFACLWQQKCWHYRWQRVWGFTACCITQIRFSVHHLYRLHKCDHIAIVII